MRLLTKAKLLAVYFLLPLLVNAQDSTDQQQSDPKTILVQSLKNWVFDNEGIEPDNTTVYAGDRRFRVPVCQSNYNFEYAFGTSNTVSIKCQSTGWTSTVRIEKQITSQIYVYDRDISKGSLISSQDLRQVQIVDSLLANSTTNQSDISDFLGKYVRIDVNEGQHVDPRHFDEEFTVYKLNRDLTQGSVLEEAFLIPVSKPISEVTYNERIDLDQLVGAVIKYDLSVDDFLTKSTIGNISTVLIIDRVIEKDQQIDSTNTSILELYDQAPPDSINDYTMVDRASARRRLIPGNILKFSDIVSTPHVQVNTNITLHYKSSILELTTEVLALENGFIGDIIRVRNSESGEELNATVTGVSTVEISR